VKGKADSPLAKRVFGLKCFRAGLRAASSCNRCDHGTAVKVSKHLRHAFF
jgi:hypothetical protein